MNRILSAAWLVSWLFIAGMAAPAIARDHRPTPPPQPAVVLVHGIFKSGRGMAWLERQCAEQGYDTFAPSLTPASGTEPLAELSAQLDRHLRERFPRGRRLHVVGFSMGGLVTRHWLAHHADLRRIVSFTTLGSPHEGTATAWLWGSDGIKDMRPGSPFLTALAREDDRLARLRPLSIYTPFDGIILPPESSAWKAAARVESIPVPLHPLLCHNRKVSATLLAYFAEREGGGK